MFRVMETVFKDGSKYFAFGFKCKRGVYYETFLNGNKNTLHALLFDLTYVYIHYSSIRNKLKELCYVINKIKTIF